MLLESWNLTYKEGGIEIMHSFLSKFSDDIQKMMEWRGVLGYTKTCYERELHNFDDFCMLNFPKADVLTWDIALAYLQEYKKRRDVRVDVSMLRNLGKYQIMIGKDACVFPANYFKYKTRKFPYIMSFEECQRFFKATDNYSSNAYNPLLSYTVAVFFRLQYATGMRPREVRLLNRNDFNYSQNTIYIADSKLHKDRCIAVDSKIMHMCKKYDIIARTIYPDTNIFFPNRNKKEHSAESIQVLFHKCWEMAGNPLGLDYCTPYILRHNFATQRIMQWMEEGKDFNQYLPYLSAYMGHQTFRETSYYLHLLPERLSMMPCMNISDIISEVTNAR